MNIYIKIVFYIIAFVILGYSYYINKEKIWINGFPKLKYGGKINYSYIEDKIINRETRERVYRPIINYRYTIEGSEITNNKISYTKLGWMDELRANTILKKFRDKDKLEGGMDVIYNPKDYSESYLEYEKQETIGYIIGVSLILILLIIG